MENFDKYMRSANSDVGDHWQDDRVNLEYTDKDVQIAQVLTRLDMASSLAAQGYVAQVLKSIRSGVWILVGLGVVQLLVSLSSE